jgi:imidazolonepropionase-like amidohydrolase
MKSSFRTIFAVDYMARAIATALFLASSCLLTVYGSDQIPGAKQTKPILLAGGTVHTVSGETIEGGSLLFVDGKITAVGKDIAAPAGAEVIDCQGKHIYPSLFDSHSQLGLIEIEAVRATVDSSETGALNPNVRAEVAFNPDSELISVTRANGVLLGLSAPTGSLVNGRSAVMQLDGWTWEDMALKMNAGMHVRWPRPAMRGGGRRGPNAGPPRSEGSELEELNDWIKNAKLYKAARAANPERQPWDARLEATLPVLDGSMPLVVEAEQTPQIESAIAFAKAHQLRLIISGAYDAEACAPLLRESGTPVIIAGVYRVPMRESDPYDSSYSLPDRLNKAGVKFAIAAADRFGGSNIRNLPYHAATAVAYGLSPEAAVRSITLSPAEILGVADRVGSLDVGKDATLFVADGDILETPTQVERAFVQGRKLQLESRHTQLFRKYSEKYKQLAK